MSLRDDASERRAFPLPGASDHYAPDRVVDVEHIGLDVRVDLEGESLEGTCTIALRVLDQPLERLELDAVDMVVERVERDGQPLDFTHRDGRLAIAFAPPVPAGAPAAVCIAYRVEKPRQGLYFIKPSAAQPQKIAHAWTQSQDVNARYWFPCLDHPSYKQTTSTRITVKSGLFALGNGVLEERVDRDGWTTFAYRQDVAHSTYLMTLVVGPFAEVSQGVAGSAGTPVAYYVLPGREADGARAFGNTPRMIECFEARTGRAYPFARYSQIAVSDFIFGGMENTGATTQTDRTLHDETAHLDFSSDFLVAHELAHQWFGDLLTCRDWSEAWLNEGFATFFEAVWREADLGYDEYLYDIFGAVARYLDEDAERYRRAIVCNRYRDPIEIFDRHLYEKGAAVLHMLRGELGEARFWRAMRHYVAQHERRNVETIDLIRAIEEATGRNLRAFFAQWVFRGGHPEVEVAFRWDAAAKTATIAIDQKQSVSDDRPAYRFGVDVGILAVAPGAVVRDTGAAALAGERRVRLQIERAHETFTLPLEAEPALVRFDPGASLLASVTYKLGPAQAAAVLAGDPDIVARIRAARELAHDASAPARAALRKALADEPFWGVLAEIAAALGATRAGWAAQWLRDAIAHAHPKVRRAAAAGLGNFRDAATVGVLTVAAEGDASYFVRAEALASLGKTRDPHAFAVLTAALGSTTWNETVESGAARGLGELHDERALAHLIEAARPERGEGLRRAAATAIGRVGATVERACTAAVDALAALLDDSVYMVQMAAIAAAEALGDARLLAALDRLSETAVDGRARRDASEAAHRIREAAKVPAQVSAMRDAIDELREEQKKLQEKLEALARS